jgi:hypothetical protein
MKITNKHLQAWEKRLPDLDTTWTHWWLEGDGEFIAAIPLDNLNEAIDCIVKNHERFSSISAYRARIALDGKPIKNDTHFAEIYNWYNDSRL